MDSSNSNRLTEIDRVKGFAILCVVCIHAKLGEGTLAYDHVVNRAVPVFLVLFGVTGELWFRSVAGDPGERVRRWYRSRFGRLLPPVWAFASVWWLITVSVNTQAPNGHLGAVLATYFGFAPWLATSWFIVMILQLVLLFPLLRAGIHRLGAPASVFLAGASSVLSIWYVWQIVAAGERFLGADVPEPGWYYQWVFAPRVFWHVTAGVLLAPRLRQFGRGTMLGALALLAFAPFAATWARGAPDDVFTGPLKEQIAVAAFDVPLAVALLLLFRGGGRPSPLDDFLAWCGRRSWGIYLGHLLVYELMHLAGGAPELAGSAVRAMYWVALLASGIVLTVVTTGLARAARRAGVAVGSRLFERAATQ